MVQRQKRLARPVRRRRPPNRGRVTATRVLSHGLLLALLTLFLHAGWSDAFGEGQDIPTQRAPVATGQKDPGAASTPATSATPGRQQPSNGAPAQPDPSPTPASLSEELTSYVSGLDGTYGIAILDLKDGQSVSINADHVFPTASLYKVLVMYRVYQSMEQGSLSSTSKITIEPADMTEADEWDNLSPDAVLTVGDAVERMITASSNIAAYALARQVGGWNAVMASASQLGMKNTTWNGQDFVTTPGDMLHFFDLLANRSLISPGASDEMTAVLLRQRINDRLPADLPRSTRVAHKTGELTDVRNDGGIVFTNKESYVIVLMSEGINPSKAVHAEATISRMVFDWLAGGQ